MPLVIIESPYAGDVETNLLYLKLCITDSLNRGEAPFASHGFYTLVLDDTVPEQRTAGMEAGWAWMLRADLVAVYGDLGVSKGMMDGWSRAESCGIQVVKRNLPAKMWAAVRRREAKR